MAKQIKSVPVRLRRKKLIKNPEGFVEVLLGQFSSLNLNNIGSHRTQDGQQVVFLFFRDFVFVQSFYQVIDHIIEILIGNLQTHMCRFHVPSSILTGSTCPFTYLFGQ